MSEFSNMAYVRCAYPPYLSVLIPAVVEIRLSTEIFGTSLVRSLCKTGRRRHTHALFSKSRRRCRLVSTFSIACCSRCSLLICADGSPKSANWTEGVIFPFTVMSPNVNYPPAIFPLMFGDHNAVSSEVILMHLADRGLATNATVVLWTRLRLRRLRQIHD